MTTPDNTNHFPIAHVRYVDPPPEDRPRVHQYRPPFHLEQPSSEPPALLRRLSADEAARYFPSGFNDYDALVAGLQPGEAYSVTDTARNRTSSSLRHGLRSAARRRGLYLTFAKRAPAGSVAFRVSRIEPLS